MTNPVQQTFDRFFGSGADGLPVFRVYGYDAGDHLNQTFNTGQSQISFLDILKLVGVLATIYLLLK